MPVRQGYIPLSVLSDKGAIVSDSRLIYTPWAMLVCLTGYYSLMPYLYAIKHHAILSDTLKLSITMFLV